MTLAELTRNASSDRITSPEIIRGILTSFSEMSAEDLFVRVQEDYHPYEDLLHAVGMPEEERPRVSDAFVEIYQEITGALESSHIRNTHVYTSNLKALSLLSQLAGLYLPPIRQKGDSE